MIALTDRQKQKIHDIQTISFNRYCKLCGYQEDEYLAMLLSMSKEKLSFLLGEIDLSEIPDHQIQSMVRTMLGTDNYFDLRNTELEYRRRGYADNITHLATQLPINYNYSTRLCAQLGLTKPSDNKVESVGELVKAVPIISNWDFEFNAFVTNASMVDNIPCVCIYETLLSSCDTFLHCVAPAIFEFGDKARLTSLERCKTVGLKPDFIEELKNCIKMALGKTNYVIHREKKPNRQIYTTVSILVEGSIQAVWFHEFGHLLQGHLERPQSHQIEFDADRFAFSIIGKESSNQSLDIWVMLGGLTTLVLVNIIETVAQLNEGSSHPSGKHRIEAALNFLKETNHRVFRVATDYIGFLAELCSPTIEQNWGVSL